MLPNCCYVAFSKGLKPFEMWATSQKQPKQNCFALCWWGKIKEVKVKDNNSIKGSVFVYTCDLCEDEITFWENELVTEDLILLLIAKTELHGLKKKEKKEVVLTPDLTRN